MRPDARTPDCPTSPVWSLPPEAARAAAKAAKERKRGDALLAKFPSDEWGAKRIEEIQHRSVINGIFPSTDEQEFIDNFDLWKEAVARRDKEAASVSRSSASWRAPRASASGSWA